MIADAMTAPLSPNTAISAAVASAEAVMLATLFPSRRAPHAGCHVVRFH
jgi:hypothetical protein